MSNLGLETTPVPAKKTDGWVTAQIAFVSLLIVFFAWNIVSNGYLLVFQQPLIHIKH